MVRGSKKKNILNIFVDKIYTKRTLESSGKSVLVYILYYCMKYPVTQDLAILCYTTVFNVGISLKMALCNSRNM
jgi:hypothetical protein